MKRLFILIPLLLLSACSSIDHFSIDKTYEVFNSDELFYNVETYAEDTLISDFIYGRHGDIEVAMLSNEEGSAHILFKDNIIYSINDDAKTYRVLESLDKSNLYPYKEVLKYIFDFSSKNSADGYITISYTLPDTTVETTNEETVYIEAPHVAYFNKEGLIVADNPGYGWVDMYYFADAVPEELLSIPDDYVEVME